MQYIDKDVYRYFRKELEKQAGIFGGLGSNVGGNLAGVGYAAARGGEIGTKFLQNMPRSVRRKFMPATQGLTTQGARLSSSNIEKGNQIGDAVVDLMF